MERKILKFGGTSVENAQAMLVVAGIVKSLLKYQPVVVTSAMAGVTDDLVKIYDLTSKRHDEKAYRVISELSRRHVEEAEQLARGSRLALLREKIDSEFEEIRVHVRSQVALGQHVPAVMDSILAKGEILSSLLLTAALQKKGINAICGDSRKLVVTDDNFTCATPDPHSIKDRVYTFFRSQFRGSQAVVLQGFIGATPLGVTTTLGRGGSDYSAALLGAALGVGEIRIYTDVDGVLTADPKLVSSARSLKTLSYEEAAELAYFGAKVLHPSTARPAYWASIPIRIMNTKNPDHPGTRISGNSSKGRVKAIAQRTNVAIVSVTSMGMLDTPGFSAQLFKIFADNGISVDVISTSEVSVSVTVDDDSNLSAIEKDLRKIGGFDISRNNAVVCVVGDALQSNPRLVSEIFGSLVGIDIRMISQGASKRNLTFVCPDTQVAKAVNALHNRFFPSA